LQKNGGQKIEGCHRGVHSIALLLIFLPAIFLQMSFSVTLRLALFDPADNLTARQRRHDALADPDLGRVAQQFRRGFYAS
jgi:hypothetical protein